MTRKKRKQGFKYFWREIKTLPGVSRKRLVGLATVSTLAGFAEAAALVVVVKVALSVTSDESVTTLNLGPLGDVRASVAALLFAAIGLILLVQLLQAASAYLATRMSADSLASLRRETFDLYVRASWPLQARQREGHLHELVTGHVQRVTVSILFFASGFVAIFNILALLISAVIVSVVAALTIVLSVTILFFALRPVTVLSRRHTRRQVRSTTELASTMSEFAGISLEAKIFDVGGAISQQAGDRIDEDSRHYFRARILSVLLPDMYQNAAFVFVLGGMVGVSYLTSLDVDRLGGVVLIMLRALTYSRVIQSVFHHVNEAVPYLETIRREQEEFRQSVPASGDATVERIDRIEFDDVSFAYSGGNPVLRKVGFHVDHGEVIGIVGPSGAGKSTLLQLLLRLREPSDGRYLVNGVDARSLALDSWYRHVAIVPQESRLFSGTARENIRFFRDWLDDDDVERAAALAYIHHDIVSWPLGYDTPVGPRGGAVSGGQKQRMSIARALAEKPDILILDEPTSSLDLQSEALIQRTLEELKGQVTLFIIAHRMSTLNTCDRIMVFRHGELQAFDRPNVLQSSNDFYQEAVRLARSSMG